MKDVKRSYAADRSRLEHHVLQRFGRLALHELTTQSIQVFLAETRQRGLAPATVNRSRSLLQAMLNLAVQWNDLERNPARGITKLQESNQRQRVLIGEDLQAFPQAVEVEGNRQADFILLLLLTGARAG